MNPEQQQPFIAETGMHKLRYEGEKQIYLEQCRVKKVEEDKLAKERADKEAALEKKAAKKNAKNAAKE